jgi:Xaa-Pro dipeptidase
MGRARLDALFLFSPESHYWLTGYDTFGYCFFQCLVFTADARAVLLTRSADFRQARLTSRIGDVRIWKDAADAAPVAELRRLARELGLDGRRIGVEWASKGLDAASGRALDAAFADAATLVDASRLLPELRLAKSAAELAYVRRAAKLADAALGAALDVTGPGADEARIQAALTGAVHAGDGDGTGNPPVVGSGPYALLCRTHSGRRRLDPTDQLTLEWAGAYRHYHAAQMRTICVGTASARHLELFDAAHEALAACEARLRPGYTVGEVYAAHAQVFDRLGLAAHRLNACGYALGATFAPSWMEWPMFYEANPVVLEPDMVFFLHMILMDSDTGTAMTLGRTSIVTDGAPEPLSAHPLELLVR